MRGPVTVGVSLKAYLGVASARSWFAEVAARVSVVSAVTDGRVSVFVAPTFVQVPAALDAFAGTSVRVGAQDVSAYPPGPYTGEVTADELAEVGVRVAEIGHAERRRLFGESDADVAAKTAAALRAGIAPVLCLGETHRDAPVVAAAETCAQLRAALADAPAGPVIVAYEPAWAIGAVEPAPVDHVAAVTVALREALDSRPDRAHSVVIYGGSAGPGLLTMLGDAVDGLFLGRFAHDPDDFAAVLAEAARLAETRAQG